MLQEAQLKSIADSAISWMKSSMLSFSPTGKKLYTFDELYYNDVEFSGKQQEDITAQYNTLWDSSDGIPSWRGDLLTMWSKVHESRRSSTLESTEYPGYLFKFCSSSPGRGNPAAHFLRVPKGKEMQRIVREEELTRLLVVTEQLITMKTSAEIKDLGEGSQCYEFVVKSMKVPVMSRKETVKYLASLSVETQIDMAVQVMKLICKSGIGDVGFHNILVHKDTKQLVFVDTEPLYGSLLLNESGTRPRQYYRTEEISEMTNNLEVANGGLDEIIKNMGRDNAIFAKVSQIYKLCLSKIVWK